MHCLKRGEKFSDKTAKVTKMYCQDFKIFMAQIIKTIFFHLAY